MATNRGILIAGATSAVCAFVSFFAGATYGYEQGVRDTDLKSWKQGYADARKVCDMVIKLFDTPAGPKGCTQDDTEKCS